MSEPDQKKLSVFTGWYENGPWFAKTVLAALAVVGIGLWFWYSDIRNSPPPGESSNASEITSGGQAGAASTDAPSKWSKPFPAYVRISISYVAGFCIGWLFRRLIGLILVVGVLVFALMMYGKFVGIDVKQTQEQVKRGEKWAQHEAKAAKDYFKDMLPSATAGGIGIFLGFLRRNRVQVTKSAA